jgi:hypothetical protein
MSRRYAGVVSQRQLSLLLEYEKMPSVPRTEVSQSALESAIAAEIKTFDSSCRDFVGVIIEGRSTDSDSEANWQVKGLRFGKSDREKARLALDSVLPQMQQQFILKEYNPRMTRVRVGRGR